MRKRCLNDAESGRSTCRNASSTALPPARSEPCARSIAAIWSPIADRGIQCRCRLLRHVRDEPAAEAPQRALGMLGQQLAGDVYHAARTPDPGPLVAEQRQRRRCLSAARFAHEPENLPALDCEASRLPRRARPRRARVAGPEPAGSDRSSHDPCALRRLPEAPCICVGDQVDGDRERGDQQRWARRRARPESSSRRGFPRSSMPSPPPAAEARARGSSRTPPAGSTL